MSYPMDFTDSDDSSSTSTVQRQLPTALQLHILSLLPPNDRALSGRPTSPDARDAFAGPQHCTASLSQPLPHHAVPWAVAAGQQRTRHLPFRHKLQLPCTAASEANLKLALALLQPSIFPELLQQRDKMWEAVLNVPCPGCAAVKAGHLEVLGWLLRHCPGLMDPHGALRAAAQYCSLVGLQVAWAVLQRVTELDADVLDAAAWSATADAVAKMEWVLATGGASCHVRTNTASAAAVSGDLGRLRWLRGRGCPMDGASMLRHALEYADLTVADWLVDEAGCKLPQDGSYCSAWVCLLRAVARSPDGAAKLQWLQDREYSLCDMDIKLLLDLASETVQSGHVEALQYLLSVPGLDTVRFTDFLQVIHANVPLGSIEMARYLKELGISFAQKGYLTASKAAATGGNLALVQYLLQQRPQHVYRADWAAVAAGAQGGCEELVEQLPGGVGDGELPVGAKPYVNAAVNGDMCTLTALRRLGVPWGAEDVVVQAVWAGCCLPGLRWLVEQGAPVGSAREMERALAFNQRSPLAYADEGAAWLCGLAGSFG